jgi:hypothetical protein
MPGRTAKPGGEGKPKKVRKADAESPAKKAGGAPAKKAAAKKAPAKKDKSE